MQFEYQHKVGTDYATVTFPSIKPKDVALLRLRDSFNTLGGKMGNNFQTWTFPSFITPQILKEVIRNTCFVCGGLMKDGEAIVDHKYVYTDAGKELWKNSKFAKKINVRKCTVCGHSHI